MGKRTGIARRGARSGPANHNWRGGRSVASNGYVLIRVGKEHHLADVRGYAYEHRLVAEQKLGRRLLAGEIPHHIDGNKRNNDPANLEVVQGNAEHFLRHRRKASGRRLPGQANVRTVCGCGCGEEFNRFDEAGRPRSFISGHNPPPADATRAFLDALANGPLSLSEIMKLTGRGGGATRVLASKLAKRGVITRVGHGRYALVDGVRHVEMPV